MRSRIFLIFCCFFFPSALIAQFESDYSSISILDTIPPEIMTSLTERLAMRKKAVDASNLSGQEKKYTKQLYDEWNKALIKPYNEGRIMMEGPITEFLAGVLDHVLEANPDIPRDIVIYGYRSQDPNAMSFGEGTIVITLGLLARLKHESQVAFVICHEIAHYTRNHLTKNIDALNKLNFDKTLSAQIRSVNRSEMDRYTNMKKLLTGLELSLYRHSRVDEFDADSMGYTYYRRTQYAHEPAVALLAALDSADLPLFPGNLNLKKHFDFSEYPFKNSWLSYQQLAFQSKDPRKGDFGLSDTTRTHPDIKRRIAALLKIDSSAGKVTGKTTAEESMRKISTASQFELVESASYFREYGKSLFVNLNMLDRYPHNAYLKALCARNLYRIYQSQKNHQFGKVVENRNSNRPENYDRWLSFLHALRLMDLEALGYYYVVSQNETYFQNEEFLYTFWLTSTLSISKIDEDKVKETYLERFPEGKYSKLILKGKK